VPTFLRLDAFLEDFRRLTPEQQARFRRVVLDQFVPDLVAGQFRPGLRVKRVQSIPGVWEMTWAPDGRATWQYGAEQVPGVPHVVWARGGRAAASRSRLLFWHQVR
jgi:hypothetical protein